MPSELAVSTVHSFALFAGQLDLSAGLYRDRCAIVLERDDPAVLFIGLVIIAFSQPAEDSLNPVGSGKRQCPAVAGGHRDFFVLGAYSPFFARFGAGFKVANESGFVFERFTHRIQSRSFACNQRSWWLRAYHGFAGLAVQAALLSSSHALNYGSITLQRFAKTP
jgi:hypothetical protein